MPLRGYRIKVGSKPVELAAEFGDQVTIKNKGPGAVDLGGPDVKKGEGYELAKGEQTNVIVGGPDQSVWAVASTRQGATLHLVTIG